MDHNDIQALKEKVEVFASTIEAEQCNRGEQLQGKVQAIEQEVIFWFYVFLSFACTGDKFLYL